MGDYAGSYDHMGDEEVKYVVQQDREEYRNSMYTSSTVEEAGAHCEGGYYCGEGEYQDEGGIQVEYSYTSDATQQVTREGEAGRERYTARGHRDISSLDGTDSSTSSEEGKPKNVKPKTKSRKSAKTHFKHLQAESPVDAYSDPGYGEAWDASRPEHMMRSQSISLVTNWLQDASLGEHPKNSDIGIPHGDSPPQRPAPPRRHPRGESKAAHSSGRRYSTSFLDVVPYSCEAEYVGKTPASDFSGCENGYDEDHCEAANDAPTYALAIESVYRLEPKPLLKAWNVMKTGAAGMASVSWTAAVGLGKVSKTAAVVVKSKTTEISKMAVPVLTPIINAVVEEGREHLIGPDPLDRGRGTIQYGRGGGRDPPGRDEVPIMHPTMRPTGPRPGMRPVMRPGMRPAMRPGMQPPMRPGMQPRMGPGLQPAMRPGMQPAMRPGVQPAMRPGMQPAMRPGMRPMMRPALAPSSGQQPVSQRPHMVRPQGTRGPGVAM